jgi:hypothetical protein
MVAGLFDLRLLSCSTVSLVIDCLDGGILDFHILSYICGRALLIRLQSVKGIVGIAVCATLPDLALLELRRSVFGDRTVELG